jgi:hypothetical protein
VAHVVINFFIILRFTVCCLFSVRRCFRSAFAETPQGVKSSFWRLRKLRKGQNHLFGDCGTSARGKIVFLVLAELPQGEKSAFFVIASPKGEAIQRSRVRLGCFVPRSDAERQIASSLRSSQ